LLFAETFLEFHKLVLLRRYNFKLFFNINLNFQYNEPRSLIKIDSNINEN